MLCFTGHSNFVSCVCVVPPDDKYPQGLILSGSNDNNILAFSLESPEPVFKLSGHSDTGNLVSTPHVLCGCFLLFLRIWF